MVSTDLEKKVTVFEEKLKELSALVDDLQKKDKEKEEQILKLSELVKKVVENGSENPTEKDQRSKALQSTSTSSKFSGRLYRGKENFSREVHYAEANDESDEDQTHVRRRLESGDRTYGKDNIKSKAEEKLQLIKRKMEINPDFERYINEGIMRFAGDASLVAVNQNVKKSVPRYNRQVEPAMMRATLVTKQMTVEKVKHSPARSGAYSYETKKYFARHGVAQDTHEDEEESDFGSDAGCYDEATCKRCRSPSLYKPGESTTYYPSRDIRRSNPSRKKLRERFRTLGNDEYFCEDAGQEENPENLLNEIGDLDDEIGNLDVSDSGEEQRETAARRGALNRSNRLRRVRDRPERY